MALLKKENYPKLIIIEEAIENSSHEQGGKLAKCIYY